MTQYIDENVFISCITNNRANYPYFTNNGNIVALKPEITNDFKKANPLNFLMINDTFHDLVNPRGTYNPIGFIDGPLNYLMTSNYFPGDNVNTYANGINFPEYQQLKGRFEPKVAKSFEINMGLQTADTFITYDEILDNVEIPATDQITIKPLFLQKIISANGSISITIDSGESSTFSSYIEKKITTIENFNVTEAYLKISYFIRWYLHIPDISEGINSYELTNSMKILFDAGSSFLKEFFSAEGSRVQPFVAIPCILDSASTSTEKLDPTLNFYFEQLVPEQVVPIVSNYFSCDKYFFCYLPNTEDEYNLDTLYGFSLAILKIPEEEPEEEPQEETQEGQLNIKIAINIVRSNPKDPDALKFIFNYINTNPGIVARYYFGQVKKDSKNNNNYNSSCGTCGAGVPYIGRVISQIKALRGTTDRETVKTALNSLKNNTTEPLGGRIPFSDARILNILLNLTPDVLDTLFEILADYKRTGDYQQAFTVLKAILTARDNSEFFTFCSGDELSALIGRLLGVPTIYQTASGAQCRLYRGRLFTGSDEEKLKYKLSNDIKIIEKYCGTIREKIQGLQKFIENNYEYNLQLRKKLRTFITDLQVEYDGVPTPPNVPPTLNEKKMNVFFKLISVRNAYNKLDKIIELSGLLLGDFFQPPASDGQVSRAATLDNILGLCRQINTIKLGGPDNLSGNEEIIKNALITVSKFEETINGLKIFNFVEENFPQYFNNINIRPILIDYDENTPLNSNKNLKIPLLGINFFSSKVKSVSSLYSTYNSVITSEKQPARGSARNVNVMRDKIRLQKIEFLNGYNEFIDSCKFLVGEFKIQSFYAFIEIMGSKIDTLTQFPAQGALVPGAPVVPGAVVPGAVVQFPTPDERTVADIMLNLSRALEQISEPAYTAAAEEQPNIGGNYEPRYNQQGGANPGENIRTILNDVKQLLLNLYNKCTNYIKNVQNDAAIKPTSSSDLTDVDNFQRFLNAISDIYETDEFCYQLLFQEADVEEENTIDNISIGFLTGLKLITEQYTYSDLGYSRGTVIEKNISINYLLHSQNDKLNLYPIKILLYILGWSNYEPISNAAAATASATADNPNSTFLLELIDTYFVDPDADIVLSLLPQGTSFTGVNHIQPVELVSSNKSELGIDKTIVEKNKSIFSILTISIMEYLYYGNYGNIYSFNDEFLRDIWRTITRSESIPNSFNVPSQIYLQQIFLTYLNSTITYVEIKTGISPSAAIGIQGIRQKKPLSSMQGMTTTPWDIRRKIGGKQRKTIKKSKTRTNSKTRKIKKTKKHKFTKRIKKSNNHKRSRK